MTSFFDLNQADAAPGEGDPIASFIKQVLAEESYFDVRGDGLYDA